MISTERFLDLLQEKELLSPRAVASLRAQIAQAEKPSTAESVAKRLIKHGHITVAQAKRLLATDHQEPAPSKPAAAKPQPKRVASKPQPKEDDELGFAPIEEESDGRHTREKERARKSAAKQAAVKPQAAKTPAKPQTARPPAKSRSLQDKEMPAAEGASETPVAGRLDFMSETAITGEAGGSLAAAPAKGKGLWRFFARKPKVRIESEEEKWGSSLMLVGGGSLLLFLILGGVLLWALTRGDADKMMQLADDDYRNSSYAQAIFKYNAYLEKFPNDAHASLARVKIGLAELWEAKQNGNWPKALEVAKSVLKKITVETEFKEAQKELASLLPDIAEGLAAEARKKTDPALVAQARQAVEMAENPRYVPKTLRPESKLKDINDSLALADREIARGTKLEKTIAAMQEAVKKAKTEDAYTACSALLHQYPDLTENAGLKKTLLAVSQAQQALVKLVSQKRLAAAAETDSAALRTITPARTNLKTRVPEGDGQIALAAVDGAVYGLDAATGKVLWRRFVGFDANPQAPSFPPTPLSNGPGSDALVVATAHNELLRLENATGRIRWRQSVGEPFDANPVMAGENILIATRGGKLVTIAAASGESPYYVQFPQPLAVAPAVDFRQSLIFQVAAHTNIFVLSLNDGACKHVAYLGHETGSITTAPVVIEDYLLVAVNDGARDCVLKVLAIQPKRSDKPEPWLKPVQEIRLGGHVPTPPLVDGRRVLVTTNSGVVRVFELSASNAKTPLRDVAESALEGAESPARNLVRFPLMQGGQFWIADNRLTKYDIQAARGRLVPKWIVDENSAYLQPPVAIGQAVVCVRRKVGMPGAIVSAVTMQDPENYWETQVGSPLAGEPLALGEGGKMVAVTAHGAVFRIDAGGSGPAIADEPVASTDVLRLHQPIGYVIRLAGGLLAITSGKGSDEVGVFDPKTPSPLISWLNLPDKQKLACAPAPFGRGLLAPSQAGPVFLLDPLSGDPLADPFQPRLEAGADLDWMTPVLVGEAEAVLADAKFKKMYRIGLQDQPTPHLAALAEAAVTKPVVGPLAVLGNTVYLSDTAGGLNAFSVAALAHGDEQPIGSRCAWGPARVGDAVLLSTDENQLLCFDAKGKRLWQTALEYGPLAGAPLRLGDAYVLASRNGIVWRVNAASGKTLGKADLGCPLGTGLVMFGQRLFVGSHDGTLYEVRQP